MNCPSCNKGAIPFIRVFLRSGRFECPSCGAILHLRWSHFTLSIPLRSLAVCLAVLSVVLGFRFWSWFVFAALFAASLAVNVFAVARFGRLEPDASPARPPT